MAGGHSVNLEDRAEHWDAPSVAVTEGSRLTRGGDRSDELLLTGQAMQAAKRWSSPKASDPEKAGPNMRGSKGDVPLPGQAVNWPGPTAALGSSGGSDCTGIRRVENLASAAKAWAAPAAQNHKGSSEGSITRSDGKSREDILSYQAEQFFRPPSSPAQQIAGGSMSSTVSPNSNQPSVKRKLNPIFVEALMRWPTGLSGFERQEMAWTRWWLLMPSYLSALVSASDVTGQGNLFGEAA
ncbi:hypothetical protein [Sphingobium sp. Z007]|uniref:hypothetical protein n=1 Tax=Sphingobium sp. Z007 TaxID=627495 RepID=UPI0020CDB182|nr:hypothetical protein [Sphingobium sp. Z007]